MPHYSSGLQWINISEKIFFEITHNKNLTFRHSGIAICDSGRIRVNLYSGLTQSRCLCVNHNTIPAISSYIYNVKASSRIPAFVNQSVTHSYFIFQV
jgi:hypothetical protein